MVLSDSESITGYIPSNWVNCFIRAVAYRVENVEGRTFAIGPVGQGYEGKDPTEKYELSNFKKDGPMTHFDAVRVSL